MNDFRTILVPALLGAGEEAQEYARLFRAGGEGTRRNGARRLGTAIANDRMKAGEEVTFYSDDQLKTCFHELPLNHFHGIVNTIAAGQGTWVANKIVKLLDELDGVFEIWSMPDATPSAV